MNGYVLLYKSMLNSVLHARNRFLKPERGVMVPSQCQVFVRGVSFVKVG